MSYRDDREALQSRVKQLESDLATAQETIDRLEGARATVVEDGPRDRLLGVPISLHLARELEVEIEDDAFEAMAEVLRARLPTGQVSQVGRTLTHRWVTHEIRVTRKEGATEITARADHRNARKGTIFGTPGLALLAGLMVSGILLDMRLGPVAVALVLPLVVIAVFMGMRGLAARNILRERAEIAGVVETISAIAARHAKGPKKRIVESEAEAEAEAEAEVEAEAGAARRASLKESGRSS